jgi:hypothetical protein
MVMEFCPRRACEFESNDADAKRAALSDLPLNTGIPTVKSLPDGWGRVAASRTSPILQTSRLSTYEPYRIGQSFNVRIMTMVDNVATTTGMLSQSLASERLLEDMVPITELSMGEPPRP